MKFYIVIQNTTFILHKLRSCTENDIIMICPFSQASWIGSIMPLSALFGGMAGGPLIESLGRRTTILSTGVPFIICKFVCKRCFFSFRNSTNQNLICENLGVSRPFCKIKIMRTNIFFIS